MAERLGKGLQNLLQRFESALDLSQKPFPDAIGKGLFFLWLCKYITQSAKRLDNIDLGQLTYIPYIFSIFGKMKKCILIMLVLVSGAFLFGLSTGRFRHFPYGILYEIITGDTYHKKNQYGGRFFDLTYHKEKTFLPTDHSGIYLTYGQSNSVNHGEIGYEVKKDVYQFFDGKTYLYKDPSLGGTGMGGSVWGMVGDKLIEKGIHDKVVFSNCGWGGKKIEELNQGHYLNYLVENYHQLMDQYGRVDGILFHQGEYNNSNRGGCDNYYDDFVVLIKNLNKNEIDIPLFLSRASLCGKSSPPDEKLIEIQNQLIEDFDQVYEGPNTDLLSDRIYRLHDHCHFSLMGYDKFADMWVESLIKYQARQWQSSVTFTSIQN